MESVGVISRGGCVHGNCCKQKIENNKNIKLSQKLLDVKEYTNIKGPTTWKQPRQPQVSAKIMIIIMKYKGDISMEWLEEKGGG